MTQLALWFMYQVALLQGLVVIDGLTPEEQLQNALALHQTEQVEPVKVGYSLNLEPVAPLRVVNADGPPAAAEPVLRVRLAGWPGQQRPDFPPIALPITAPPCQGVCVSFSSQGAEGLRSSTGKRIKGVQLVAANICTGHPATFGAGAILGLAGTMGYQWHAPDIGTSIIERTVSLNWRSVVTNTIKYGTMFALDLAIPGAINLSVTAKTILAAVHTSADQLPQLFSPGAPNADPYLKSVIDPNGVITVGPERCQVVTFSAVYPGGPKTTGTIQLLP